MVENDPRWHKLSKIVRDISETCIMNSQSLVIDLIESSQLFNLKLLGDLFEICKSILLKYFIV